MNPNDKPLLRGLLLTISSELYLDDVQAPRAPVVRMRRNGISGEGKGMLIAETECLSIDEVVDNVAKWLGVKNRPVRQVGGGWVIYSSEPVKYVDPFDKPEPIEETLR